MAGNIAGVDVVQSRFTTDSGGAEQVMGTRIGRRSHFVILMKSGDVPGDVGRNSGQKCGQLAKLIVAVVEAWDEQGDDLQPHAHLMQSANGVENGLEASAKLAIAMVVETLEVDFVEIDPGMEIVEHLGSSVAIGHEGGEQAGLASFAKNGDGPLAGDERLVVGADYNLGALGKCVLDEQRGIGSKRRGAGMRIAQRLGGDPVLAIGTVQIAAQHSETVGQGSGVGVEEWFLLDGIALGSGNVSPGNVELASAIEADFANAGLSFGNGAAVTAGITAEVIAIQLFPESGIGFANAVAGG